MAGRRPVPTEIKKMTGNPGKRKLNENEPKPALIAPKMPRHLNESAQREWKRIVKELRAMNLLTHADGDSIALYASSYALWIEASAKLASEGMVVYTEKGYPVLNPHLSVINSAVRTMKALLIEFGMTPAARSRISIPNQNQNDEFDDFLRSK